MPEGREEIDQAPLFGPGGRIPAARTVTLVRESAITTLRKGWLPRHTVAVVALSPLVFSGYVAALGIGLSDPSWTALLGVMAVVAALILTSYLPLRGARLSAGSSCGVMAGLLVPGVGMLLGQASGIPSGVLALAILGLGLWQRVSGASACG